MHQHVPVGPFAAAAPITPDDFIYGDDADNAIEGTEDDDEIQGYGGNDRLSGLGGDDLLVGGSGRDTLDGGTGSDHLVGGRGSDSFTLDLDGADTVEGGAGTDVLSIALANGLQPEHGQLSRRSFQIGEASFTSIEIVELTLDDDEYALNGSGLRSLRVSGGNGDNDLVGSAGADSLSTGTGEDTVDAGAGNDQLRDNGNVILDAGAGDDTIALYAEAGNENVDLYQSEVHAGSGDDRVEISLGVEAVYSLDGGSGDDRLVIYGHELTTDTRFNLATDRTAASLGLDAVRGFESLEIVTGSGVDRLTGGAQADSMLSDTGNDRLNGAGGDDTLDAGMGADRVYGGEGNDTLSGNVGYRTSDLDRDRFYGGAGNDAIEVSFHDVADGGDGIDTATLAYFGQATGGPLRFTVSDDFTVLGDIRLRDIEAVSAIGTAEADAMTGGGYRDTLSGAAGDDVLDGGGGDDVLSDGLGNDTLNGGAGSDVFYRDDGSRGQRDVFNGGTAHDTVDLSRLSGGATLDLLNSSANAGDAAGLRLSSIESAMGTAGTDRLLGTDGTNWLDGYEGDDRLQGRGGDDHLYGGSGADTLTGGAGQDEFVFRAYQGADVVTDFGRGDHLALEGAGFGLDAGDEVDVTVSATLFESEVSSVVLVFVTSTSELWVTGSRYEDPVLLATLTGVTTLSSDDVVVL